MRHWSSSKTQIGFLPSAEDDFAENGMGMPDELAFGAGAHCFCDSLQKSSPPGHRFSHAGAGAAGFAAAAVPLVLGLLTAPPVARGAITRAALADAALAALESVLATRAGAASVIACALEITVDDGSIGATSVGAGAAACWARQSKYRPPALITAIVPIEVTPTNTSRSRHVAGAGR